jgi:hypothetical protein
MKENYSLERKKRIGDLNRNKTLSIATRLKLNAAGLLRYQKDPSLIERKNK